jgi:hypothetical protein
MLGCSKFRKAHEKNGRGMLVRLFLYLILGVSGLSVGCLASETDNSDTTTDPYFLTPPPSKVDVEPYSHNGSDVIVESRGESIHIRYEKPRKGLISVGVKEGTLLFSGWRTGDTVKGTAFLFKANCKPVPYDVRGRFDSRFTLVLEGSVPRWDPGSCAVVGYTNASRQSQLVFFEAFGDI